MSKGCQKIYKSRRIFCRVVNFTDNQILGWRISVIDLKSMIICRRDTLLRGAGSQINKKRHKKSTLQCKMLDLLKNMLFTFSHMLW